jgi:hypothetical protein
VTLLAKLLIPLALAAAVLVSAITVPAPNDQAAKPSPAGRSLQQHR